MKHVIATILVAGLQIVGGVLLAICKICAVVSGGLYVLIGELQDRIEQWGVSQNAGNGE